MIPNKLFLVCLMLLVGAAAERDTSEELDIQLDDTSEVDISGKVPVVEAQVEDASGDQVQFKAPYYDPIEKPLPLEIQRFAGNVIKEVLDPAKAIIKSALVENSGKLKLYPQLASVGLNYIRKALSAQKESKQLSMKYKLPIDEKFQDETMSILPDLIEKAKAEAKKETKDDGKKYKDEEARVSVGHKLISILDGVKQLVLNSPVGSHLKFKNVTMNDEPMLDSALNGIKFMRKTGLGWIIDAMGKLCQDVSEKRKKEAAKLDAQYKADA